MNELSMAFDRTQSTGGKLASHFFIVFHSHSVGVNFLCPSELYRRVDIQRDFSVSCFCFVWLDKATFLVFPMLRDSDSPGFKFSTFPRLLRAKKLGLSDPTWVHERHFCLCLVSCLWGKRFDTLLGKTVEKRSLIGR